MRRACGRSHRVVDFEQARVNEAVPEEEFKFMAPPGTTTVRP